MKNKQDLEITVATKLSNLDYLLLNNLSKELGITKSELLRNMALYVLAHNWKTGKDR